MTKSRPIQTTMQLTSTSNDSTNGRDHRADPPHDGHDVAIQLRRVSLRAFHAVNDALNAPDRHPAMLREVHAEIVVLEAEIGRLGLRGLHSYVASLRRQVESASV